MRIGKVNLDAGRRVQNHNFREGRELLMTRSSRSATLAAASLVAIVAATSGALAGGFAVREQSATAQGYSFAGAASGSGGLSSMFWNPATITMAPGWQSRGACSRWSCPDVKINPLPPTPTLPFGGSGDIGQDAFVPLELRRLPVQRLPLARSREFGALGLVTDPRQNWSGQVYSRSSRIFSAQLQSDRRREGEQLALVRRRADRSNISICG